MIKILMASCMVIFSTFACAGEKSVPPGLMVVKGVVLEVRDVESYTYLRLKTRKGETWAAVNRAEVQKGSEVTIENAMVMHDFESKSLHKTFKTILFGTLGGAHVMNPEHASAGAVARAVGENAQTVEEIISKSALLKDKSVLVRGKIVKYNPEILGKNWIHLRDGTGSDGSNDILVTTTAQAKVGDVVTVAGVVHTDRDFGSGYIYKVLIEDATLQP
jgi:hypothetical protein